MTKHLYDAAPDIVCHSESLFSGRTTTKSRTVRSQPLKWGLSFVRSITCMISFGELKEMHITSWTRQILYVCDGFPIYLKKLEVNCCRYLWRKNEGQTSQEWGGILQEPSAGIGLPITGTSLGASWDFGTPHDCRISLPRTQQMKDLALPLCS